MAQLRIAHTSDLERATLAAARALLVEVFEGDLTEHDWEHALGGVHALMWDHEFGEDQDPEVEAQDGFVAWLAQLIAEAREIP